MGERVKRRAAQRGFNSPLTSFTKPKPRLSQRQSNKQNNRQEGEFGLSTNKQEPQDNSQPRHLKHQQAQCRFTVSLFQVVIYMLSICWWISIFGDTTCSTGCIPVKTILRVFDKYVKENRNVMQQNLFELLPVYYLQGTVPPTCWM